MSDAFQTAQEHQRAGRLAEAAEILNGLLRANSKDPKLLRQIALLLQQAGQPHEGLRYLGQAIALRPADPVLLIDAAALRLAAGQPAEAAKAAEQALALDARSAEAANNLGLALGAMRRFDQAEAALRRALDLRADFPDAQFNLANLLRERGDLAGAIALYRALLDSSPRYTAARVNLGTALELAGDLEGAAGSYRAAIAAEPPLPPAWLTVAHLNLAQVLQKQNRFRDAAEAFRLVLARDDRLVAAQVGLGQCARELGDTATALAAFERAARLAPDNEDIQAALSGLLSGMIPGWHLPMLADAARNDAYDAAIRKAVKPGMIVLDIGTGSGLLAMMAARAGAKHVIACEAHRLIAGTAAEIVARNGMADRITVIAKRSTELQPGHDMPEPADLLVAEVLDAGLIGEGALPTNRDALRRLVKTGAKVMPAAAQVVAQVVALPQLRMVNPLRVISGFDLSPFDRFRNRSSHSVVRLDHEQYQPLSEITPVLRIDFANPPDWTTPQTQSWSVTTTASGTAQAVVFWFDLWLDETITVSTGPGGAMRHWGQAACWLPVDLTVTAGALLPFTVELADNQIHFRPA